MNKIWIAITVLGCLLLTGCNIGSITSPTATPPAQAPILFITTETPSPMPAVTNTPAFTPTATSIPPVSANFCADPQVTNLIDSLKSSILTHDGSILSSLVSPNGMEVRYFHNSKESVTYSANQATFLYETSYQADWGASPGSGQEKKGSFHEVIVPALTQIFNLPYTLHCNEIRHGGASYPIAWPYPKDFYAIYYAGTEANGNLDWNTWVVGIEYVNAKPYIYALMQFFWEP